MLRSVRSRSDEARRKALRAEHYAPPFPTESFVRVATLADPARLVEIEAIGVVASD
ncbi:hypothetical protein ACFXGT_38725 [Streptomyces sp. NPDC059352]|uniref:hypothetical protein n=1 Tax=Streptomyces sp. NPDC059352 TaxID=3346810 RepID=UPI0036BA69B3